MGDSRASLSRRWISRGGSPCLPIGFRSMRKDCTTSASDRSRSCHATRRKIFRSSMVCSLPATRQSQPPDGRSPLSTHARNRTHVPPLDDGARIGSALVSDALVIRGAREHNLRNVSLELPRDKLVVLTGISGSGKSSLAFDTIYAEGQRRYVESLSAYARQFLGQMDKPDVDFIEGLSPAISIDQKSASRNPRS